MPKPPWLKVKIPSTGEYRQVRDTLRHFGLYTVCEEARCPNVAECFHEGTATFLILGKVCSRHCRYCNVTHGEPRGVDEEEPERLVRAAKEMRLKYVVITSVTRDDLPDGGAGIFAACIELLHRHLPESRVEVLIPDFRGSQEALNRVIESGPEVINHNMEVARPLFHDLRPEGDYMLSLRLLRQIKESKKGIRSKSGFMVGYGEKLNEIKDLIDDLAAVDCDFLTIGQYLQPTRDHWPVQHYYSPEEFGEFTKWALEKGFKGVASGPLVRSSYHAALSFEAGILKD
ncbi:MAG: lipoyl synthase [Deltaproteobacteria bacterium]|nr:lipoyl synthase [Deltaproteobacteria bacterium]